MSNLKAALLSILFGVFVVGFVAFCMAMLSRVEVSQGTRSAKLLKLSHRGVFVESWEGQLGIFSVGEYGAEPFEFTVHDEDLARELAQHVGQEVEIEYVESLTRNVFLHDTSYNVVAFEVVE